MSLAMQQIGMAEHRMMKMMRNAEVKDGKKAHSYNIKKLKMLSEWTSQAEGLNPRHNFLFFDPQKALSIKKLYLY